MCIYSIITIVEERAKDDFIKKFSDSQYPQSSNPVRILDCAIGPYAYVGHNIRFWTLISKVLEIWNFANILCLLLPEKVENMCTFDDIAESKQFTCACASKHGPDLTLKMASQNLPGREFIGILI